MKARFIYAMLFITIFIVVIVLVFAKFLAFPATTSNQPQFDIHEEVANLRDHWGESYSMREYDWVVWHRQWEEAGVTFTKMNGWNEFTASLEMNQPMVLMLDEQNRVVWYVSPFNKSQVIYVKC